eukprot:gene2412-2876_t
MSTLKEFNENEEEVAAIFQTEDEPFQRQTAQRFSHISTIQKVNLCFWMICWNLPQFIVAIVLCALYFRTCIEQTIWILIYVSLSMFEPMIFLMFYFCPYKTTSLLSRLGGFFAFLIKGGILIWGIIWTIFYAETGCVHLVRLEIVYLILGVCGISFRRLFLDLQI